MKKILGYIVLAIVVLVGGLLAYASTKPGTFQVQRSTVIAAPPTAITPMLVDFRRWSEWSPYEKLDPAMKRTYGGAASGVGATYAWDSKGQAGAGRMEIQSVSDQRVTIRLDFTKPLPASNIAEFTLEPQANGTKVTWSMRGPNPLICKVMDVVFGMDKLVGKDFETGLASLKARAEAAA